MNTVPQPVGAFEAWSRKRGRVWRLSVDYAVIVPGLGTVRIAAGFESDGASIPRPLWQYVGPPYHPQTFPAALVHDALYAAQVTSRAEADAAFRALLVAGGCSRLKARAYWCGVRAGGWWPWRRKTAEQIAAARQLATVQATPAEYKEKVRQ